MAEYEITGTKQIMELPEAAEYTDGMYYPVGSATGGTERILTGAPNAFNSNLIDNSKKNDYFPVFEMGNISLTGEETESTINFRTDGFISPYIIRVQAESAFRVGICKYDYSGKFIERVSSFNFVYYEDFDFSKYQYRIIVRRSNDGTVSSADFKKITFESNYIDSYESEKASLNGFSIEFEQGNIAPNGADMSSDYNIKTKFILPSFITKVTADEGFKMAVCRWNKNTGAFVDRSDFNLSQYTDFDFDAYQYKILLNKPNTNNTKVLVASDSNKVHFFDRIGEIENKANSFENCIPLLDDYLNKNGIKNIITSVRGAKTMNDMISNDIVTLNEPDLKTHDASLCVYNDKFYVVRAVYSTYDNAAADDCTVVLTICDLDGSNRTDTTLAKKNDVFGDYSIVGGCGSPNLFLVESTLHILFTAKTNGNLFAIFHGEYDTTQDSFSNVKPIKIDGNLCTSEYMNYLFPDGILTNTTFNGMQMNASIATDGTNFYGGLCKGTSETNGRGCILKTTDFENWDLFAKINEKRIHPIYEIACAYKNGYVFAMCRASYGNYKGYLVKFDNSGNVVQECYLLDGSSRPDIFEYADTLILLNTNDSQRQNINIINLNHVNFYLSERHSQDHNSIYQYMRGFVYNNIIYTCRTTTAGIVLSVLNLNGDSDLMIRNQLVSLFE